MKRILVHSDERRKESRTLPCLTSAGHMLVQWLKSFATLHRSIESPWKCPKDWFGVTNKFWWVDRFANTKSTNEEDWKSVYSTMVGRLWFQFLLHHCCITFNKLFILSLCWFPLLHLLNCYWTFKTHEQLLPPWGFSKNLSWKWIVSFSPQVTPPSWTPATLSLCLRCWPCCWTAGQLYPTLTVLLSSSSSSFLVPSTATSCPPWPMTAVWLCTNPCFTSP